jgi:Sec-independent protein translocase protein TatA
MNLFGVGGFELLVVLVVGFLALGPNRSIDAARTVGKTWRDLRDAFNEIISAVNLDHIDGEVQTTSPSSSEPTDSVSRNRSEDTDGV